MNDQPERDQHQPQAEEKQREQSSDEQERLRQLYLEQQRRLACPGCGEAPFLG